MKVNHPKSSECPFKKIKSQYIVKNIFEHLEKKKVLQLIKYNKNIQKKLEINVLNYIEMYEQIEQIEIIVKPFQILKNGNNKFINIEKEEEKDYFHVFFNDSDNEEKRCYFMGNEEITKIKIILDYKFNSFNNLFENCECIGTINFTKFKRNNILDMSYMFKNCSSLVTLDLSHFNTNNVKNMCHMFGNCSSLSNLDLTNFNTNNVEYMSNMFERCQYLYKLNLSNFNTIKVTDMKFMFSE